MRLTSFFKDLKYLLLGLLPLFFAAGILFLSDPLVWSDEAIYMDIAKNWLQTRMLKTDLFHNAVYGLEEIAAWYPPLYFYVLGTWIKWFGSSIESVRYLSLFFATSSLITVYFLAKKLFSSRNLALLTTLLISCDYFFSRSSRIARMDMFNFMLLSFSYWLLFWQKPLSLKKLFLAGIFSGLALISHPLGLIGPVIIIGWLWFSANNITDKVKQIMGFITPGLVFTCIWLLSLLDHWQILLKQWDLQIDRKSASISYVVGLWQGKDFGWQLLFLLYFLLFVLTIFLYLSKKSKANLFIIFGLVVSTVMLIYGKEMFYPLYFQPFISLMLVSLYLWIKQNQPKILLYPTLLIGLVFFLNIRFFMQTVEAYTGKNQNYYQYGQTIKNYLPQKATVYLSALPDPYFMLQENPELTFLEFPTMYTTNQQYYALLDKADYVVYNQIFDQRFLPYLELNEQFSQKLKNAGNYDIMLLKLKPKNKRQWPKK